ncbi:hypothetical protein ACFPA8_21805 [Streptomyces ovatisporus]|uniref:Uncharacterized protein n=1 Tax=Streptomyces ovatisporus TaxID=1128682 RepID=A0ABV9ACV5_9ACTN
MDLDEVADELYGLRPEDFTAARNDRAQQARSEGQRELAGQIRGLRRPTLAAWASNLLVRERQEEVAPLLRLGEELRGAHRNLDGEELRTLSHQQHQLVAALSRQAAQLASGAGQPLGPQAQQEVAQTLQAVMSDPDAAREWAAGRLAKPLSVPAGFDAAAREAAGAQARGGGAGARGKKPAPARTARRADGAGREKEARTDERTRAAGERARREAREAADRAEELRRKAESAAEDAGAARAAREASEENLGRLRDELRQAELEHSRCRKSEREADRTARETRRRAEEAEKRARQRAEAVASARERRSGGNGRGGRRR